MIPEIIEQMRKELYDTKLCISDFEKYDLKTLEKKMCIRDRYTSVLEKMK